ncbi:MAG: hypothetical protein HC921_22200 [Synechococcaceae cyanobacterium SM2_3_1]|nr:hypothetical protein [Synechococcaceae cyanobacterium SM2_3_1]
MKRKQVSCGWVYEIDNRYHQNNGRVPPEAIIGAWKVDQNGNIIDEFIPNPNYRSKSV